MKQERISTHVLDVSSGRPAAGLKVSLHHAGRLVGSRVTDAGGRVADVSNEPLEPGPYRLVFEVGEYFGQRAHLFSRVGLEFDLPESGGHYHIPLLVSPYSSTAYR